MKLDNRTLRRRSVRVEVRHPAIIVTRGVTALAIATQGGRVHHLARALLRPLGARTLAPLQCLIITAINNLTISATISAIAVAAAVAIAAAVVTVAATAANMNPRAQP